MRIVSAVMQVPRRRIALAALAFTFAIPALADISQTVTLQSNTTLSFDTGATSSSGGDLLWNGTTLAPQGKARVYNVGNLGAAAFANLPQTIISSSSVIASSSPIGAAALVVGDVFVVITNGGNGAKVLVTANSGGSITLQFTTYIAATPTGPTITSILNNSSRIPTGLPNSGVAPSSLFVIIGTGLAAAGDATLHDSGGAGLQTTLNGASVAVTVAGTTVHPALYYATPTQIDAVLPHATPPGTGTLTVTYNGGSSSSAIQVVASAPGISTYNGSGIATDAVTGALLTYASSGTPGEIIILWGTGLGADPADSDTTYTGSPHAINVPLVVYIGGVQANVAYAGASVYPGVDVIGVTIPANVLTGCWIPVAVVANGVLGNVSTLPINSGGGACIDAQTGLNGNQISPSGGQTIRTGLVSVIQSNTPSGSTRTISSTADAAFEKYTGLYTPNSNSVSPGGCIVDNLAPATVGDITGLDAGVITLSGPSGLSVTLGPQLGIAGAFFATLATGAIPQSGGTFTFKGSGGADVGSFTSTITFSNPLLTWTNQNVAVTIDRTKNLTFNWTGGNPGTYLYITGVSTSTSTPRTTVGYTCLARVDDGQFTVPSYILSALPAGSGGTGMQNDIYSSLSASGLDIGSALGDIYFSVASSYQ